MEGTLNDVKFKMTVPYNNQVLVAGRKNQKKLAASFCLFGMLVFGIALYFSATAKNFSMIAVVGFTVFVLICLISAIYMLSTLKARKKDNNKSVTYTFHQDYLEINQNNTEKNSTKNLKNCLYRKYKNKQYIKKIVEHDNRLEIFVYVGTYNGIAQNQKFLIPIPKNKSEKLEAFKNFLKQQVGADYIIKQ